MRAPKKPKPPPLPRLHEVRFTKEQLLKLPEEERELLMRVGLVSNDVLLLQRLWAAFMYRDPRTALAKEAQAIQSVTVLLLIAGKVFEAIDGVFNKRFLSSPLARAYLPKFSMGHRKAVEHLKTLQGSSSMLAAIRNTHAFHYVTKEPLSPFIEAMPAGRVLSIYLGDPDGNTMNPFAAEAAYQSLLKITGESTPAAAILKIQDMLGEAIEALFQWTAAVQGVAIKKMLGPRPRTRSRRIEEDEHLPQDKIVLPFFMSVPAGHKNRR